MGGFRHYYQERIEMAKIFQDEELHLVIELRPSRTDEKVSVIGIRNASESITLTFAQFQRLMAFGEFLIHPKF
jgi:hypothetical protein